MPRSLHIIGSKGSGGAECFYLRLLPALARAGETVHAMHPPGSIVDQSLESAITRTPVAMRSVWDFFSARKIKHTARLNDTDIVQTYMGRATRLTHFPRGQRPIHVARLGGYYNLKGYRHAHAWVGNTLALCDHLVNEGLPRERVFYIGNFFNPAAPPETGALEKLRTQHDIPADALIILAASRLHPNKGIEDLVAAFAKLPTSVNDRRIMLVIAGDGPMREELHQYARQLQLDDRIRWAGWQTDTSPWFSLADIIVLPSRHETLGNVILEAWSHHKPIVSTASLGGNELITHEVNGLLTPLQDPDALARALQQLLEDDSFRTQLSEQGLNTLNEKFSEQVIVSAYQNLYTELLQKLR